jgi:hypothetical protein
MHTVCRDGVGAVLLVLRAGGGRLGWFQDLDCRRRAAGSNLKGGHKQASKDMAEQANLAPKQGYGSARGKAKEVDAGYEGGRHGTTT